MSASGTASKLLAKVKTDTAPVPIRDASAVRTSAVIEPMPSASERGMESRTMGDMNENDGNRRRGMTPVSSITGIFTARYATAPMMTP